VWYHGGTIDFPITELLEASSSAHDPWVFCSVHKAYLHVYVATYEAPVNSKQGTTALIGQTPVTVIHHCTCRHRAA